MLGKLPTRQSLAFTRFNCTSLKALHQVGCEGPGGSAGMEGRSPEAAAFAVGNTF